MCLITDKVRDKGERKTECVGVIKGKDLQVVETVTRLSVSLTFSM